MSDTRRTAVILLRRRAQKTERKDELRKPVAGLLGALFRGDPAMSDAIADVPTQAIERDLERKDEAVLKDSVTTK
jgi:hypothetical protein